MRKLLENAIWNQNNLLFNLKDWSNNLLTPKRIKENWLDIMPTQKTKIIDLIKTEKNYANIEEAEGHFANEQSRLTGFRNTVIPWLNSVVDLRELQVLEIGCGACASSVALAEQGAIVTGIDIEQSSLKVGKCRLAEYGIKNVKIKNHNAERIREIFSDETFDVVIFFASLEHMTIKERLESLKSAWAVLKKNGYLCIIETPNRLWWFDNHTSMSPFFDWLPDEIAFRYADRTPKIGDRFMGLYPTPENLVELVRMGRGMSWHELELGLDDYDSRNVVSCLGEFLRKRNPFYWVKFQLTDRKYFSFLRMAAPTINPAFLYHRLDLMIQKN
jgi:2-polyprenyl-3-methyl-5-hydroxy-6-metoxy-1,4-benzoquinol methylase